MKAAEARKLIGKRVTWMRSDSRYAWEESAIFDHVEGRNVRTSDGAWLWLPDIGKPTKVEEVPA